MAEENQENIMQQRVVPLIERKLAIIEGQQRISYEMLTDVVTTLMANISDISTGRAPVQINIVWSQGSPLCVHPMINQTITPVPPLLSCQ